MSITLERFWLRKLSILSLVAAVSACAGTVATVGAPFEEPDDTVVPSEPDFTNTPAELRTASAQEEALGGDGHELFQSACSQCHSVTPPAKQAPPMAMVVRRYRNVHETEAEARGAMLRWIGQPEAQRSALPSGAVDRFGLMPAQPLPTELAERVVDYVLTLDDGPGDPPGHRPSAGPVADREGTADCPCMGGAEGPRGEAGHRCRHDQGSSGL